MIKTILTALLVSLPIGAQAMGMYGYGGRYAPGAGVHMTTVLYALLAALGYWVLQHAAKETVNYSKRAGQVVGWTLITAGLAGMLCGLTAHVRSATCPARPGMGRMMMPGGGMPGGMMVEMEEIGRNEAAPEVKTAAGKTPAAKKPEAAPQKK